jgi:predicted membrane-bound spermidine synthase
MALGVRQGLSERRIEFEAPVFAFVGSGCLLVLELVAARLIAPTLGVSLYTWTSVIGVVLAGISLGNYLGGRVADRWPSRSTLALLYLAASGASLLVLGVLPVVGSIDLPGSAPALLQVLWVTAVLFLLPSTVLGMPTPLLTRLSLHAVEEGGRVVGRIQAAAALGSIVCTFLTGFWLISWFGTRHLVAGVAAVLLLLAVWAGLPWLLGSVYLLGAFAVVIVAAGWVSHSGCTRESNYYCIKVKPGIFTFTTVDGRHVKVEPPIQSLFLDHLQHSIIDLRNPTHLLYGYEQLYARVMPRVRPLGSRVDSFFVGGGGYVFPRWMEAKYRGQVTVAEIDPEVTRIAREQLGLRSSPRLTIVNKDARRVLESTPSTRRFDAIFGDAFNDYEVPFHLTTREFDELVAAHLRPRGIYLLNVVDGVHYDFLRSKIRTLRLVFPYVAVVRPDRGWPPSEVRDTFVIVAAKTRPTASLMVVSGVSLDTFVANGHSVVLTDDHVPVDQLLAPVFTAELHTR